MGECIQPFRHSHAKPTRMTSLFCDKDVPMTEKVDAIAPTHYGANFPRIPAYAAANSRRQSCPQFVLLERLVVKLVYPKKIQI